MRVYAEDSVEANKEIMRRFLIRGIFKNSGFDVLPRTIN